jgi:hypothetical protein
MHMSTHMHATLPRPASAIAVSLAHTRRPAAAPPPTLPHANVILSPPPSPPPPPRDPAKAPATAQRPQRCGPPLTHVHERQYAPVPDPLARIRRRLRLRAKHNPSDIRPPLRPSLTASSMPNPPTSLQSHRGADSHDVQGLQGGKALQTVGDSARTIDADIV